MNAINAIENVEKERQLSRERFKSNRAQQPCTLFMWILIDPLSQLYAYLLLNIN